MSFTMPWEEMLLAQQGVPAVSQPTQQEVAAMPVQPQIEAPSGDMGAVVNPSPKWIPQQSEPASPEDYNARKSGWEQVLTQFLQDPNMKQVMLTVGTRLMQGTKPGQGTLGGIADAIQQGALHYSFLESNQKAQAMKEREMQMKEAESAAMVDSRKATTAKMKQDTAFDAQEQPTKMEKLQREAKTAGIKLRIAELEQVVAEAQGRNDPTGEKRAKMELDKSKAELARIQAATGASNAAAEHSRAGTSFEKNKVWAQNVLLSTSSTPEELAQAREVLYGKSAVQAKKDEHTLIKNLYKEANPGTTDTEASSYALEHANSAKGDALRAAITIMNTEPQGTPHYESARNYALSQIQKTTPGGTKPGAAGTTDAEGYVTVTTPAEAQKLPPGTKYKNQQGTKFVR